MQVVERVGGEVVDVVEVVVGARAVVPGRGVGVGEAGTSVVVGVGVGVRGGVFLVPVGEVEVGEGGGEGSEDGRGALGEDVGLRDVEVGGCGDAGGREGDVNVVRFGGVSALAAGKELICAEVATVLSRSAYAREQ